jgi:hypothetical protein
VTYLNDSCINYVTVPDTKWLQGQNGTTVSVLSEDSGVGSEDDLAWNVQEDVYSSLLSELSRSMKQRARSLDELTGSLSIDCTIPLLVPPVQYQDEKESADGEKEWETAVWNSRKHSNYFQARQEFFSEI